MSDFNTLSKIPLHLQSQKSKELCKAEYDKFKNESYESFRPNEVFPVNYKEMDDSHVTMEPVSRLRRYANGALDYSWVVNQILDALHGMEYNDFLTPLQQSLLTVLFPQKFRLEEPALSQIRTMLSQSEKDMLERMVIARIKEELNYNVGEGGGSVPGRSRTLNGVG